jgi:hypothetical protein
MVRDVLVEAMLRVARLRLPAGRDAGVALGGAVCFEEALDVGDGARGPYAVGEGDAAEPSR